MEAAMSLEEGIKRIYGNIMRRKIDLKSSWYLFTPYQNINTLELAYFRILQAPASYHTSEDVYAKCISNLKGFIHQVEIIHIQRSFQTNFYLLKASTNIISLQGLIDLRLECSQNIQPLLIYRMIEFLVLLEDRRKDQNVNINTDNLGLVQTGHYRICDYSLYFLKKQETKKVPLKIAILALLIKAISLNQQTSLTSQELYMISLQHYDLKFANFVSQLLNMNPFINTKVMQLLKTQMPNQLDGVTTLSESSFIEDKDFNGDVSVEHGSFIQHVKLKKSNCSQSSSSVNLKQSRVSMTSSTHQSILDQSEVKNTFRAKKIIPCVLIFIVVCLVIAVGLVAAMHFINHPIKCSQGQFIDPQNKCLACNSGCQRCMSFEQNQCLSCKGAMYLVIKTREDKTGICMSECKGKFNSQRNACIENP